MKRIIRRYTWDSLFFIHHYVLMNTHVHLLAWSENTGDLARTIKAMLLSYHHYFRKRYAYKGHLWHSRYRSKVIVDENQWLQCGRYIELNPVHAGICSFPEEYLWSSYNYYANGKDDSLLRPIMHPNGVLIHSSDRENVRYREFLHAGIDLDYHILKKKFES
jgi:putative transposase